MIPRGFRISAWFRGRKLLSISRSAAPRSLVSLEGLRGSERTASIAGLWSPMIASILPAASIKTGWNFIYAKDTVIPEYLVKKRGYFKREDAGVCAFSACSRYALDTNNLIKHCFYICYSLVYLNQNPQFFFKLN